MKRRCYTKIKKVFEDSAVLRFQMTDDGEVYVATEYLAVHFPDWLYRDEFLIPDAVNYPGTFLTLLPGDKLEVKHGEISENGPDLAEWFHTIENGSGYNYLIARPGAQGKLGGKRVRFCDSECAKVLLNNKYYDAMTQAARGGNTYADAPAKPVLFYDNPEISRSVFTGCVLPIRYKDETRIELIPEKKQEHGRKD